MVIGICYALGQSVLSKRAFKNPRSEVFSFPLWKLYESLKTDRRQQGGKKYIILLKKKKVPLTKSHLVNIF